MLTDFIEKIKQKPPQQRQFFVWIAAIVIMVVIVSFWLAFGIKENPLFSESDKFDKPGATEKASGRLKDLFDEARGDLLYLKDQASQKFGDFFSGKNDPDPEDVPDELKQYIPQEPIEQNRPIDLPSTD